MKKILLILTLVPLLTFAQDNIILKNGEEINTKIMEINVSNVKYKKYNNQDGPLYTISKDEIFLIKYSNGEKEILSNTSSNNSKSKNIKNKKILISGASTFYYQNTFENDNFYSSSNLNLTASVGGFLTRNFVLGASFAILSNTSSNYSSTSTVIGPYIRGYNKNFYSQVGYTLGEGVNALSIGLGHQLFLNESESVSLNPTIIYFSRNYTSSNVTNIYGDPSISNPSYSQDGILIGCSFEFHL